MREREVAAVASSRHARGELYDEYTDLSPLEAQVEELGKRQSLFEAAARDSKWDAGEEEENVR